MKEHFRKDGQEQYTDDKWYMCLCRLERSMSLFMTLLFGEIGEEKEGQGEAGS